MKTKDQELYSVNEKLVRRSKDIARLRAKIEEHDKIRITRKTAGIGGLNPNILSKVIDTETVLREAHKSLERRMMSKENNKHV